MNQYFDDNSNQSTIDLPSLCKGSTESKTTITNLNGRKNRGFSLILKNIDTSGGSELVRDESISSEGSNNHISKLKNISDISEVEELCHLSSSHTNQSVNNQF